MDNQNEEKIFYVGADDDRCLESIRRNEYPCDNFYLNVKKNDKYSYEIQRWEE